MVWRKKERIEGVWGHARERGSGEEGGGRRGKLDWEVGKKDTAFKTVWVNLSSKGWGWSNVVKPRKVFLFYLFIYYHSFKKRERYINFFKNPMFPNLPLPHNQIFLFLLSSAHISKTITFTVSVSSLHNSKIISYVLLLHLNIPSSLVEKEKWSVDWDGWVKPVTIYIMFFIFPHIDTISNVGEL